MDNNHYLDITKTQDGKIRVSSSDGVFSSIATRKDKIAFQTYCDEKAHDWLTSDLGNYAHWKKKERKEIADKWLAAKELPEGEYNYYFNLGDIRDTFRESVAELAKSMNITDYELIVK